MYISLSEYSPSRDGVKLNTDIFNQAIFDLNKKGGGVLYIEAGKYLVGNVCLEDNVYLYLDPGAEIIASSNYNDFKNAKSSVMAEQSFLGFIFAKNKNNIGILGKGLINGNAPFYHSTNVDELGYRMPNRSRIRTIIFESCENILLEDFTIKDAPMWTVHCISCRIGNINNIKIINDFRFTNTDAIDIDGCSNFNIQGCYIKTADDGICLKTSEKSKEIDTPCENILVSNCIIESHSSALKIGTESYNNFNNIKFNNCIISNSNRGISLVTRDGGCINNVTISDMSITTKFTLDCHWGKADPIFISVKKRDPNNIHCGQINNVTFNNINIISEGAINIHSEPNDKASKIFFNNINQCQVVSENKNRGTYDIRPPCNPNQYDNNGMNNAYYIPLGESRPWGVFEYPNGIPAIFINGISKDSISINNCYFSRENVQKWSDKTIQFYKDGEEIL
ncbi:glycoside hydrolase family 28 protein [Testudinibacter sp. P80/BLE/0925]|uniref:glycoside hydrolase family 28 protein n=1 Tax=Testudinibacter sp. TW-1 TaxID=3417757 RepID=UPI003D35D911